ncbi:hypothetical protein Tco_1132635 [Tanacetum coccineum]|uniref:Retrovirus-related Pol polyprotein from transposon TNT 1-94-like beta-barrel domain-containing protein n=1 Tax=Tanacetum coccineum TaxID=301880 RepID=A0ABQ5JCG2_9ASTR
MSDSEGSTVTYTEVSSPFEVLSDIGSMGVDGLPMIPEDPYAYVVAAFQAPPSSDYVPGPEEPEQAPPSPEFVPQPVYPKFMPPKDEMFPAEEQPLPAAVSPTTDSPGYIANSDPEEDEEDPKEDPTDYPADGGDDDDDDDESSDDDEDDDDDVEEDEDEEEEVEHPAPADSVPPPVHRVMARMSVRAQTPISLPSDIEVAKQCTSEVSDLLPCPDPYSVATQFGGVAEILQKTRKICKTTTRRKNSPRSNNQRAFIGGAWSDSGKNEEKKTKDETCLVAQASNEICLGINLEPDEWIKDSGCSKHMMGNRKLFSTYKAYNGGNVIFGSNLRGNIIGKVKESLNVTFDETPPPPKTSPLEDDDLVEE